MYTLQRVESISDSERFCSLVGLAPLAAENLAASDADAHWMVLDSGGAVRARCSLWWTSAPGYHDHRVGLIGHYAAADAEAAAHLLPHACRELALRGCTLAIGPMDGSTHRRYRLLTERGSEPPFFLEPDNPDDWPAHFINNGFTVLERYVSALQVGLDHDDPRASAIAERLAMEGVTIRHLDVERFADELRGIYNLVAGGFRQNVLYSPISEAEFLEQYGALRPFVRPELVVVAEHAEQPIGFMLTVPDWLQARRREQTNTVIVKTLAVHPEYAGRGLATLLAARCQVVARDLGFSRAIHALMHERNTSRTISQHFAGRVIRRYALFARQLDSLIP